jgi:hypothetical protein
MCIPAIIARQRLGKDVIAETKTQATIEELSDALFSMRPVSYLCVFVSHIVARQQLGKHIPATSNTRDKEELLDA